LNLFIRVNSKTRNRIYFDLIDYRRVALNFGVWSAKYYDNINRIRKSIVFFFELGRNQQRNRYEPYKVCNILLLKIIARVLVTRTETLNDDCKSFKYGATTTRDLIFILINTRDRDSRNRTFSLFSPYVLMQLTCPVIFHFRSLFFFRTRACAMYRLYPLVWPTF
jgi:hypothetical protein